MPYLVISHYMCGVRERVSERVASILFLKCVGMCACVCARALGPNWYSASHCQNVWRTWVWSFMRIVGVELTTAPFFPPLDSNECLLTNIFCSTSTARIKVKNNNNSAFVYDDSTAEALSFDECSYSSWYCAVRLTCHCFVCTCSGAYYKCWPLFCTQILRAYSPISQQYAIAMMSVGSSPTSAASIRSRLWIENQNSRKPMQARTARN